MYTELWAEKLYRGFARNLTQPFQFVCYVDRPRTFAEPITQRLINSREPGYGDCIQPYELGVAMILVGLDTVITGNIDHLAEYCLSAETIALPRDPYMLSRACNGVALVPAGQQAVATSWAGENDMEHMRAQPHVFIDDLWPGEVVSYKGTVRDKGLGKAKVVFFHGEEKAHQLADVDWIAKHWR